MKYLLVIFIGTLFVWMFTLLERSSGLDFFLFPNQGFLFVSLAILAGSALIALCVQSSTNDAEVYRAYCKVTAELDNGPLTREELAQKIGSKHDGTIFESGDNLSTSFSQHQSKILERLIYEGKIMERNGKLSLPS